MAYFVERLPSPSTHGKELKEKDWVGDVRAVDGYPSLAVFHINVLSHIAIGYRKGCTTFSFIIGPWETT